MSKVILIGISKIRGGPITKIESVDAINGKGLVSDRKFRENNNKKSQLTLIESENISYYNRVTNSSINPLDFRRNIVTEGVRLNKLVNKEFLIGNIRVKGHDLCYPCKYLQEKLCQEKFVKILINKAGLRCEILTSGKIFIDDVVKIYD